MIRKAYPNPKLINTKDYDLNSTYFAGRRASLGAITLLKLICFSAGGPFLGCPRMITESPDRTYKNK